MDKVKNLLNVIIVLCSLLLAASYFLPTEASWSPSDAWYGYYNTAGDFVSGFNVGLVEIFPYAAGLIILLVLALLRWPTVGAFFIMGFSIVWLVSAAYEELGVADHLSHRFPNLWPILLVLIAVPASALALLVLWKFRTQARVLTLAAILAAVAILHQAYSIAWYLLEDRVLLNIGSVTGVATAAVIFVGLLVQRQICLSSEKAVMTQEQSPK